MEFWFPEQASLILKSVYALSLFGMCFCVVGVLWYLRQHALHQNLLGILASGSLYQCLGAFLVCASTAFRISGPNLAPPLERLTDVTANLVLGTGVLLLIAGEVLV
jgi:hypothetical protein